MWIPNFPRTICSNGHFPIEWSWHPFKKSFGHAYKILFLDSILLSILLSCMFVFVLIPCCFDYCIFVAGFEIKTFKFFSSIFPFQMFFSDYSWSLEIPSAFQDGFFYICKNYNWGFGRDCINLQIVFDSADILTILRLLIPEQQCLSISVCLFKFLSEMFCSFRCTRLLPSWFIPKHFTFLDATANVFFF